MGEIAGTILAVLAACAAVLKAGAGTWRFFRSVNQAVDHVGKIPAVLEEQVRINKVMEDHMADEAGRHEATDERLSSIERAVEKVAGWVPPMAEQA